MRKCERLAENFYGVDMYCGKIDLTKHRASVFFFIVEHTEDEDFISKQAVQLLTVRCRDFHFFGKQEPIWHFGFDVADMMMYPDSTSNTVALTSGYENFDEFVDEIRECINCRYLVPTDVYLVYDDKEVYHKVLRKLGLYTHNADL